MNSKIRPGTYGNIHWWFKLFGMRWGYMRENIGRDDCPYLHREVLFLGPISLRYHIFLRSDDDRAVHDHPWAFVTFPFQQYTELYESKVGALVWRDVKPWRLHYRKLGFKHRVRVTEPPVRTIVITGPVGHHWGFWKNRQFLPWKDYIEKYGVPACADPVTKK